MRKKKKGDKGLDEKVHEVASCAACGGASAHPSPAIFDLV